MAKNKLQEFQLQDDTMLPYQVQGTGKTIIFIHGLFGKSQDFKDIILNLKEKYCCISYDMRGHGQSKADTYLTTEKYAQDLKELIEHFSLDDVILVGYSLGALTIFSYIQQFGCKYLDKVVLIDITPKLINDDTWKNGLYRGQYSATDLENDLHTVQNNFMKFTSYFTYRNMTKYDAEKPYRNKATLASKVLARVLVGNSPQKQKLTFDLWKNINSLDYRETLKEFHVPVALFYADPGSLFAPDVALYMQNQIPGESKLVPFVNASHALLFSHGKQVEESLLAFLQE